jgi:hypothetical protein
LAVSRSDSYPQLPQRHEQEYHEPDELGRAAAVEVVEGIVVVDERVVVDLLLEVDVVLVDDVVLLIEELVVIGVAAAFTEATLWNKLTSPAYAGFFCRFLSHRHASPWPLNVDGTQEYYHFIAVSLFI